MYYIYIYIYVCIYIYIYIYIYTHIYTYTHISIPPRAPRIPTRAPSEDPGSAFRSNVLQLFFAIRPRI